MTINPNSTPGPNAGSSDSTSDSAGNTSQSWSHHRWNSSCHSNNSPFFDNSCGSDTEISPWGLQKDQVSCELSPVMCEI